MALRAWCRARILAPMPDILTIHRRIRLGAARVLGIAYGTLAVLTLLAPFR